MSIELSALVEMTERGWAVFPCHSIREECCTCGDLDCSSPGKHPRISNGVKGATTDPIQVEAWARQFPDANWALATGMRSGVFVVDIDKHRYDGEASFRVLLNERRVAMPKTFVVQTGGGGWHYYFRATSRVKNRVNARPGVDVRGDGGYVLLPGSKHISGTRYVIANDSVVAHVPWGIMEGFDTSGSSSTGSALDRSMSFVAGIPEGSRDDQLFKRACALRRLLRDDRPAIETLILEAARNSDPPFPEADALRKVEQAFRQDHSDGDPFGVSQSDFWNRRSELRAIYTNARNRLLAPWGVLGGAIQRALHTVPTRVAYRSALGRAPLNSGIITVGETGLGKGRTQRLLDETLRFGSWALDFDMIEVGSGEALVDAFAYIAGPSDPSGQPKGTLVWRDPSHARLVMFDEVGKLAALAARDGATIFEYIKSGLTGETVGRVLAGGRGVLLPKNEYRLGVTINLQPKVAWSLMTPSQIAGGLPGRFLWFSTVDPTVAVAERGEMVDHVIAVPEWPEGADILALPQMDAAHEADQRAAHLGTRDPMDGHALLAQAKVAVGLMVLAGRSMLIAEDWELSEMVMQHSRATRGRVLAELASEQVREEQRRGRSMARTQTFTEDEKRKRDIERIAKKLVVLKGEGVPRSEWRRRIASRERDLYEDALAAMAEA